MSTPRILEFSGPILQGGFGNDNKMGAVDIQVVFQVGEEGNSLKRFTKALREC